ncbi:MAG TPA: 4Fe-4S binding protein [Candidatus Omnitrophota bacterium]|nr:4Fe-4S binding protein [Candidatus Omnitrophota bacterium]
MKKPWVLIRRLSQCLFLVFFVYVLWSTTFPLHGKISPEILFQIDPLVMFFTSLSERVLLSGVSISMGFLLLSLILGRFFCGWICPLGTMSDWMASLNSRKKILNDETNRWIRKVKYLSLGIVAIFAILGIQIAWVFDPIVIAARFVSLNVIPAVTWTVEKLFIFSIQNFNLHHSFVYDAYRALKQSFLGIKIYYFSNALVILLYILLIFAGALIFSRLWCRVLCPLGAIFALVSKRSLLERQTQECAQCQICQKRCRMGAIHNDASYQKSECILCMDCVYDCPGGKTRFGWQDRKTAEVSLTTVKQPAGKGITRKEFLFLFFTSLVSLAAGKINSKNKLTGNQRKVIRPPGALTEAEFVDRCIRCGNCMKVCPTNGLQPVMMESGAEGIWTPKLVPEIGYCEYACTMCGQVCPTGAIGKLSLPTKQNTKIGIAVVNHATCYTWAYHKNCLVCEEHCPVSDKAIKVIEEVYNGHKLLKPQVDPNLCIGCGICQNVCPQRPMRAIQVRPF